MSKVSAHGKEGGRKRKQHGEEEANSPLTGCRVTPEYGEKDVVRIQSRERRQETARSRDLAWLEACCKEYS